MGAHIRLARLRIFAQLRSKFAWLHLIVSPSPFDASENGNVTVAAREGSVIGLYVYIYIYIYIFRSTLGDYPQ